MRRSSGSHRERHTPVEEDVMTLAMAAMWVLVGLLVEGIGSTATIIAVAGWAAVLALLAAGSRAFRHPPALPATPSC